MSLRATLLLILSSLLLSCSSTERLFNEKDLSGWEIYGTEKWFVQDGLLVSESGPNSEYGYLATEKSYQNFELELDFLQEENGNSGVFFRSDIEGTRISGWQVEVAPPGLHTGGIYESYGRGWLVKPQPQLEEVLKFGQWNHLKIRVKADKVTTWLNGVKMVEFEDSKIGNATGKIALQIHDGGGIKVYWKNIKLRKI